MATENDKLVTVQKSMQLLSVNDDLGLPLKKAATVQNVMDLMNNYFPYHTNPIIQMFQENTSSNFSFSATNLHHADMSTWQIELNINQFSFPQKSELSQNSTNYINVFSFESFKIADGYVPIPLLCIVKKYITYTAPYSITCCKTFILNETNDYTVTYENILNNSQFPSGNQNTNIEYLRIFLL